MRLYRLPQARSFDDLTLGEARVPEPGRGQVLVRMRAASLNYRDLVVATGRYSRGGTRADLVPLSDGAGEVVKVGADVRRVAEGDRVAGIFMQNWIDGPISAAYAASALGGSMDGVLAEYVLFEQHGLVHLPRALSFEEGATLPCAAVTAWSALHGERPLRPGDSVLLLGTGGVSVFALQFAKAAGGRAIITSSSDAKLERAAALGADDGINYLSEPEWDEAVRRLTGGRGVDQVVEVGGAGTLPRSMRAARIGGAVHLIGVLSGGQVDPIRIMHRALNVRGVRVGSRAHFEAMNRAIEQLDIHPVIDRVFDFEQAPEAYRYLESQRHVGKVVVRIA